MSYTISQVAKEFEMEAYTLRYYEKEGIISPHRTPGGARLYTDEDIAQLEMALCLRSTGMPIKEIRRYFQLVAQGESTVEERLELFAQHKQRVLEEIEGLQKNLCRIEHKMELYQQLAKKKADTQDTEEKA